VSRPGNKGSLLRSEASRLGKKGGWLHPEASGLSKKGSQPGKKPGRLLPPQSKPGKKESQPPRRGAGSPFKLVNPLPEMAGYFISPIPTRVILSNVPSISIL